MNQGKTTILKEGRVISEIDQIIIPERKEQSFYTDEIKMPVYRTFWDEIEISLPKCEVNLNGPAKEIFRIEIYHRDKSIVFFAEIPKNLIPEHSISFPGYIKATAIVRSGYTIKHHDLGYAEYIGSAFPFII